MYETICFIIFNVAISSKSNSFFLFTDRFSKCRYFYNEFTIIYTQKNMLKIKKRGIIFVYSYLQGEI
jgi:hypothetical protein